MKAQLPNRPTALRASTLSLSALTLAVLASGFTGGSCGVVDDTQILPEPLTSCDALGENACVERGDCTAVFEQACACAACEAGRECPPCGCDEPVFSSCHANDPCAGLDEAACNATPTCETVYIDVACPAIACAPGEECEQPVCPEGGVQCQQHEPEPICPGVACTLYCEYGFADGPDGCPVCACNEPPPPVTCEPVACNLYCENGFTTDERGCEICACEDEPQPPVTCEPVACRLYCETGFAVDENGCEICECNRPCDDGSEVLCDAIPPECDPGETAAVRNGCYDCVDAETCE